MTEHICEKCNKNPAVFSAVIQGIYYHLCRSCMPRPQVSSGHARWERDIDIIDNEAAIQQPHNSDGSINTKFAKLYPKQAAALFSTEELRRANM